MKMFFYILLVAAMGLTVFVPKYPASAASDSAFQRLIAKFHSLKTYQATINESMTLQVTGGGAPLTRKFVESLAYKSPNKLAVDSGSLGYKLVSDGKTLYQYLSTADEYTAKPAPANLLFNVLLSTGGRNSFKQVGTATVNGVPVDVVKGVTPTPAGKAQTTLYIGKKDSLLYRMIAAMSVSGGQGQSVHVVTQEDFGGQKQNAAIADSQFRFVPPANATKVASFGGPGGGGGSPAGIPGL